jgi:DNA anti-recombination protein RmuC
MAARKPLARNNHLEEAMALLIRNQAALVEQIARNDQERLALKDWHHKTEVWQHRTEDWQRKTEDWQRETQAWERKIEDWQRNALERFDKIEERLAKIETSLIELPKTLVQTIFDQIPKIKKEIGLSLRRNPQHVVPQITKKSVTAGLHE